MKLNDIHRIYFLGIGGIGMSALARHFLGLGKHVSGYDRVTSLVTDMLAAAGAEIAFTDPDAVTGVSADLVVYTPALPADHPFLLAAAEAGIPVMKRAEVLGLLSRHYRTLAVAGTHGKTTTSSMLAHVLTVCGSDPTAFLGGIARNFDGNYRRGESELMVTEADEFDRSFMTLHPETALFTSLDADHLDIYGDLDQMEATYLAFAGQARELVVAHPLRQRTWPRPIQTYGLDEGDYQAQNLRFGALATKFDWVAPDFRIDDLHLSMPGVHNVLNMTGALALAHRAGANLNQAETAVSSFKGIYRRFEVIIDQPDTHRTLIDDYAHHPTEIDAAIDTARRLFPKRTLVVVFQPHLYTRTADFHAEFAQSLKGADHLFLLPIYPAREEKIPGVTRMLIADALPQASITLTEKKDLISKLIKIWSPHTTILALGAGDIDREIPRIKITLEAHTEPLDFPTA